MSGRFAGMTAVVTGGARGIGAAVAGRLVAEGAAVHVADVVEPEVPGVTYVPCDVSSEAAWEELRARVGRLDVLVSNAFMLRKGPADEVGLADWNAQLAVNLTGFYLGVRTFIEELRQARGSVVAVSSVHANFGIPGHPSYAAAKGGLLSLTRQLAVEYGPAVRVNAVLPGPILTAAWDGVDEAGKERSARATVAGRLGEPGEVAAAVAFLASREASYITGATLTVDGGWSVVKDSD